MPAPHVARTGNCYDWPVENERGDVVFLVRVRQSDPSRPWEWRGSVHEVATGRRFYVSGGRDVADFIDARLAERTRP